MIHFLSSVIATYQPKYLVANLKRTWAGSWFVVMNDSLAVSYNREFHLTLLLLMLSSLPSSSPSLLSLLLDVELTFFFFTFTFLYSLRYPPFSPATTNRLSWLLSPKPKSTFPWKLVITFLLVGLLSTLIQMYGIPVWLYRFSKGKW